MIDETLLEADEKMDKAVEVAKEDFATIRTGRANPGMFSQLTVDYYGSPTPLQQLASFHTPEARTILITPYDKSAMTAIEKSLRDSDLGVNPTNDGNLIRVSLPRADRGAPHASTSSSPGTRARTPGSRSATSAARPRRSWTASSRTARPARTRSTGPRRSSRR